MRDIKTRKETIQKKHSFLPNGKESVFDKENISQMVSGPSTVETAEHSFSAQYYDGKQRKAIGENSNGSHHKLHNYMNSQGFQKSSQERLNTQKAISPKETLQEQSKKPLSQARKISGAIFLMILMLGLFIFTDLTSIDIFFWLFFIAMFWYRLDSRISIGGALVGLVVIMFLSAGQGFGWWQSDNLAEQIAVAVYFFLVIGVIKQIWEYKSES